MPFGIRANSRAARGRARPVRRDRRGSVAVEFVIAVPMLLLFLLGTIQFGGYFVLHQEMARAAREAARALAVGGLDEAQAVAQVQQRLAGWSAAFAVTATRDTDARVTVSVPYEEAALVRFFHSLQSGTLKAGATMRSEV